METLLALVLIGLLCLALAFLANANNRRIPGPPKQRKRLEPDDFTYHYDQ